LGVLIGLALGVLGGGGSILTVPALVYALGEPARTATTESLVIVGAAAVAGTIAHARAGHVRFRSGLAFGTAGIAASYAGTAANGRVDPNVLLLAFAALMVAAGLAMTIRRPGQQTPAVGSDAVGPHAVESHAAGGGPPAAQAGPAPASEPEPHAEGALAVLAPPRTAPSGHRSEIHPVVHPAVKVLVAGLAVGLLTGFFGVGGGFVIVPALVMVLGYPMPAAVGTSLLVIAVNSAAALTARIGHTSPHWSLLVPFGLAALAGALAGRPIADLVPAAALSKAFTVLLFAVAGYVAIRAGLALTG
jgi:uncharacterized membrane protein YfcA